MIVGEKLLDDITKQHDSQNGEFVPTRQFAISNLEAAELDGSDLRRVDLSSKVLRGANLSEALLDGARLAGAQLQGADLSKSKLRDADLGHLESEHPIAKITLLRASSGGFDARIRRFAKSTQLQGARLAYAQLQGANLGDAGLQGADLNGAHLEGADLRRAGLQGANLGGAHLQGADLSAAQLQSADLSEAEFQGADLTGIDAVDADLSGAFVYRADVGLADLALVTLGKANSDRVYINDERGDSIEELSQAQVDKWIAAATQFAEAGRKAAIVERFDRLKENFRDDSGVPNWAGWVEAARALDPDGTNHRHRLVAFLGDLACWADGAPYVLRVLITPFWVRSAKNGDEIMETRLPDLGEQFAVLKSRLENARKNPGSCPGVVSLTDSDWHQLEEITTQ
jgi:uncharacterized protein YjbI with pentapeptide repeats